MGDGVTCTEIDECAGETNNCHVTPQPKRDVSGYQEVGADVAPLERFQSVTYWSDPRPPRACVATPTILLTEPVSLASHCDREIRGGG